MAAKRKPKGQIGPAPLWDPKHHVLGTPVMQGTTSYITMPLSLPERAQRGHLTTAMLRGGCLTIQALGSHGPWRDTKSLHKGEVLSAQYFQLPSGEYFLLKPLKILKQPLPVSPSGLTVSLGSQLLALWLVCEKKEDVRCSAHPPTAASNLMLVPRPSKQASFPPPSTSNTRQENKRPTLTTSTQG